MKNDNLTARCVRAAQLLKHTDAAYYAPVIRLLLANEQQTRKTARGGKRMIQLQGVKGKSGRFPIDAALLNPKGKR